MKTLVFLPEAHVHTYFVHTFVHTNVNSWSRQDENGVEIFDSILNENSDDHLILHKSFNGKVYKLDGQLLI